MFEVEDSETALTERDRQRVALRRSSPLPVPFRAARISFNFIGFRCISWTFLDRKWWETPQVAFAPAELQELQGRDFQDGADFAARCRERRLTATLGSRLKGVNIQQLELDWFCKNDAVSNYIGPHIDTWKTVCLFFFVRYAVFAL